MELFNHLLCIFILILNIFLLRGTTYWDPSLSSSAALSITTTQTVSSANSNTISANLGLKVPIKALELAGQVGYSNTSAYTYTQSNSITHTRTLDRNCPKGYYSLQSTVDADEYEVDLYLKDGASYFYNNTGRFVSFRKTTPYLYLRYTTTQH